MSDLRKGDILDFAGGKVEVLKTEANSEGGLNLYLKFSDSEEDLSPDVLRAGGPDEREGDSDNSDRSVEVVKDDNGNTKAAFEVAPDEDDDEDDESEFDDDAL